MLSVGVSVGMRRGPLAIIHHYHVKILVIPAGIIAGALAGGALLALATDWTLGPALSVAGGLGWYSLSGAAVSRLAGPEIGSIAFLASLLRELFSFFLIPFLARELNGWSAIAPAAATSEDTTLPMLIRYTNKEPCSGRADRLQPYRSRVCRKRQCSFRGSERRCLYNYRGKRKIFYKCRHCQSRRQHHCD